MLSACIQVALRSTREPGIQPESNEKRCHAPTARRPLSVYARDGGISKQPAPRAAPWQAMNCVCELRTVRKCGKWNR